MKLLRKYHSWRINKMQKEVDGLYAKNGFTHEVLEKQAKINKKRHKYDITDESKRVNGKYVQ